MAPKASIIIPFYNARDFLERSLVSACKQSEQDIEIICVDDGSTDSSADVARRLAQLDKRIKFFAHESNLGRLSARQTGVGQAAGDFIMFLDADDELAHDAVERALAVQQSALDSKQAPQGFDIVQFAFDIRYKHFVSEDLVAFNNAFTSPPDEKAFGDDVVHVVFRDRKTTWSLCGKLMRSTCVKEAILWTREHIDTHLQAAEDACLFFLIASMADSYIGIPDYAGYVYNIDDGTSGAIAPTLSLEQFERDCQYADAMNAISRFVNSSAPSLAEDAEIVRYEHLLALSDKLLHKVEPANAPAAFDALARAWGAPDAVAGIAHAGWHTPADTIGHIAGAHALNCSPKTVKTIAAYHHTMSYGGAEHVCAQLVELWQSMGYKVVLFCDEDRSESAFNISPEVEWVRLPAVSTIKEDTYSIRAHALAHALEEHKVDLLVYHQWWNPLLCWDMLTTKACNVAFYAYVHSIFTVLFQEGRPGEYNSCRILRHADVLIVLSELDKNFWQQFNPQVFVTNNPCNVRTSEIDPAPLSDARIVWVGRMAGWDKQPSEALEVFARVYNTYPQAKLDMVGPAPNEADLAALKAQAASLGIEGAVSFAGATDKVMPFYKNASVHLITSAYEGWCLALAESKAAGVPCVMFDLPYLTLTQGNRGIFTVAQGDRDAAAEKILELLNNEELRHVQGRSAREHAIELEQYDYQAFWQGALSAVQNGSPERLGFEALDEQWDLTLRTQLAALEAVRNKAYSEVEGSITYKVGNTIVRLPRYLRDSVFSKR
ncbi:MAG: glycosyltransferase [Eggerthellaceae bacterium]|nr:glycosyltransferase [Eggerthellaceae bacterium]